MEKDGMKRSDFYDRLLSSKGVNGMRLIMKKRFFRDKRIASLLQSPFGARAVLVYMMLVRLAEKDYPRYYLLGNDMMPIPYSQIHENLGISKELWVKAYNVLLEAALIGTVKTNQGAIAVIYVNTDGLFEERESAYLYWNCI